MAKAHVQPQERSYEPFSDSMGTLYLTGGRQKRTEKKGIREEEREYSLHHVHIHSLHNCEAEAGRRRKVSETNRHLLMYMTCGEPPCSTTLELSVKQLYFHTSQPDT